MKLKYLASLLCGLLLISGCDDTTNTLGTGMLPTEDGMQAFTTRYDVTTRSYVADAVFARTSTGYVGKFTDPEFGDYESGFLTELNCTEGFSLPVPYTYDEEKKTGSGVMAGDSVVSVQLVVYYSTWFGDSLNACRMSAYELDRKLEKNRYTNIKPEDYYSKSGLLGRKAYSAYDTSVPDSVREATDSYGNSTYSPAVVFPLDKDKFGEDRILKVYRKHPEYFKNADTFIENVFKGVYLKSDYGDGTILYVDRVDLQMQFRFHYLNDSTGVALKKTDGTDSLYYSMQTIFASTKEVIQANQFKNSEKLQQKASEKEHTYIKSPAGIFTQATLPYDKIYEELANDTLNAVRLTFTNYRQPDNYKFSMKAPANVLLIRKNDYKEFFEENQLTDNITSYTVAHNNVATNQYTFSNIARLVSTCINEKQQAKQEAKEKAGSAWDEDAWEAKWSTNEETKDWDKVLLIPVKVSYDSSTNNMISIQNDLQPTYAKLKGGDDLLELEVTYTKFGGE